MRRQILSVCLLICVAAGGAIAQQRLPQVTQPKATPPPVMQPQATPPLATQPRQPVVPPANRSLIPPAVVQPQITPQVTPPRVFERQPPSGLRQDVIPPHVAAQIVRADPLTNSLIVRSGLGADAREFTLRVNDATRFFGKNRLLVADGLHHSAFVPGATIWYQAGSDGTQEVVSDVRAYDPNQADQSKPAPNGRGQIAQEVVADVRGNLVRVDPPTRSIVIQTPEGERELRIADEARVWDANRVLIAEGVTYRGLRSGATVWLRLSSANPKVAADIRLYDPNQTELNVRGEIVSVDPDMNVFVARTAQGNVEYRVTSATQYWDVNRLPLEDGMSYRLFRPGTTVWLRLGTLGSALIVKEMRFYDPNGIESRPTAPNDIRAQVVRVSPETGRIVLFWGEGNLAAETEYIVTSGTRYWDENKMPFTEGLSHRGIRPGVTVWFRYGAINNVSAITELRLANPTEATPLESDPVGALGYRTFPPGTFTREVGERRIITDVALPSPAVVIPFVR